MAPQEFCYWLQGFFELKKTIDHCDGATPETMQMIEDHLKLVFDKVTPDISLDRVVKIPADTSPEVVKDFKELLYRINTPSFTYTVTC